MADFYCIPTDTGAAKLAAAGAGGPPVNLTHYAVGDANGVPYQPLTRQDATDLVNERHLAPLESVTVSPSDARVYIARIRIPPDVGGWNICEIGLIDADGDLLYLANYPNNYKPVFSEGAGGELVIPVHLLTDAADSVTVVADPNVIGATQAWVDEHYTPRNLEATELVAGLVRRATEAQALDGLDPETYITPATLLAVLTDMATAWEESSRIAVGDLYFTTVNGRNPGIFLGYGAWELYAQGRALVGIQDGDPDFGVMGQTGGAKLHTLSVDQIPSHRHDLVINGTAGGDNGIGAMDRRLSGYGTDTMDNAWNYAADTGGGEPHNNLQPYVVVAIWRRTA